jgi:hypothetical protein
MNSPQIKTKIPTSVMMMVDRAQAGDVKRHGLRDLDDA